ncbi:MAG: hypothetical protein WA102_01475 [Candidatus Methanoperedens sp.]
MSIEDQIAEIQTTYDILQKAAKTGTLMLIDLANSTAFKNRHPEPAWLKRLLEFRQAVLRGLGNRSPSKFLGDGVLCFFPDDDPLAFEVLSIAKRILQEIKDANKRHQYSAEYILEARVVLDYGEVYLFDRGDGQVNDPQGSCVDRLFRVEKYILQGCIGFTEYFATKAGLQNPFSIGRYRLKGLGDTRHKIFLLEEPTAAVRSRINVQKEISALADIWDLGYNGEGEVFIIGGYIPPDKNVGITHVEMGDKDALVETITNFAKIERIGDIKVLISSEISEEQLRENIVCIGGPYHNSCCLRMMREIKSPYIFDLSHDETPLINQIDTDIYYSSRDHTRITKDYGFFARFTNPLNEERHVILVCGIETYGVHGAVRAFSGIRNNAHFLELHDIIYEKMRSVWGSTRIFLSA